VTNMATSHVPAAHRLDSSASGHSNPTMTGEDPWRFWQAGSHSKEDTWFPWRERRHNGRREVTSAKDMYQSRDVMEMTHNMPSKQPAHQSSVTEWNKREKNVIHLQRNLLAAAAKARAQAEAQAKAEAEAEAFARAEAEAKAAAEVRAVAEAKAEADAQARAKAEAFAKKVAHILSLSEPPEEAVREPDGTSTLELEDASMLRWSQRLDGTWRKPERRRAGWVGDLERETYVMPKFRGDQLDQTEVAGWQ